MSVIDKSSPIHKLKEKILKREQENSLRTLKPENDLVDFCSNDYLGFAHSNKLAELLVDCDILLSDTALNGSTGSRLLTGNTKFTESLEQTIANYHNAEAGLIFNSGYVANVGLFSCIGLKDDTILYDELCHASIIDGTRLSFAKAVKFKHNDTDHLKELLKKVTGTVYVAVESVYSMDGDIAPLKEISKICEQYSANLIVDEAHATGVFGKKGDGLVCELGLEKNVFARVHTFGKALGIHGAVVIGSKDLREYLINFSRPFIYTTALPPANIANIKCSYALLEKSTSILAYNKHLIHFFKEEIKEIQQLNYVNSNSCIQAIIVGDKSNTKLIAEAIQLQGYDVRPILSPTVPEGTERLRICIHSFNTEKEIVGLIKTIKTFYK